MSTKKTLTTKYLILVALFAALTAICSQIMLPIGPVPINLATFAVFLSGGLLGGNLGALSQIIYVLLGAIGVPVFVGFGAGFGKLFGPTGGYIAGYVVAAYVTGVIISRFSSKFWVCVGAMSIGLAFCYLLGTLWFMYVTANTFAQSLLICVVPFLIGDALKIMVAATLVKRLQKAVTDSGTH